MKTTVDAETQGDLPFSQSIMQDINEEKTPSTKKHIHEKLFTPVSTKIIDRPFDHMHFSSPATKEQLLERKALFSRILTELKSNTRTAAHLMQSPAFPFNKRRSPSPSPREEDEEESIR